MEKRKLFVFAGKPGTGKTTIIDNLFFDKKIIHVSTFLSVFRIGKKVPDHRSVTAYQNLYAHLTDIDDPEVALEIGTNHPELNISELEKLQDKYEIKIFLCVAPDEILYRRAESRGMRHSKEAFENRMRRDFPNTFLKALEPTTLDFIIVDTSGSTNETLNKFCELIGNS